MHIGAPRSRGEQPVCRLIYAIYGHPESGDCWSVHLSTILKKLGFKTVEGWPGLFFKPILVKGSRKLSMVLTYVDDLILSGMDLVPRCNRDGGSRMTWRNTWERSTPRPNRGALRRSSGTCATTCLRHVRHFKRRVGVSSRQCQRHTRPTSPRHSLTRICNRLANLAQLQQAR